MPCPSCVWKCERVGGHIYYYCEQCGAFSQSKPALYQEETDTSEESSFEIKTENMISEEKCVHNWICLRDRCHNRGDGKYKAYKCEYCNKFQRRK